MKFRLSHVSDNAYFGLIHPAITMASNPVGSDPEQPPLSPEEKDQEKKEHDSLADDQQRMARGDPFAEEGTAKIKYKTLEWW